MVLLFYFLVGIVLSLGILAIKGLFFRLARRSVALFDSLIADIDEDVKFEQVNAKMGATLRSLGLVVLGASAVLGLTYFLLYLPENVIWIEGWPTFRTSSVASWTIPVLGIGSLIPFVLPRKRKTGYSDLSKLFHHLVLDNYHLGRYLLKRQIKGVSHPVPPNPNTVNAVIVTGLARAGTTALTRLLAQSPRFATLNYGNMPVLLAPRFWLLISSDRAGTRGPAVRGR